MNKMKHQCTRDPVYNTHAFGQTIISVILFDSTMNPAGRMTSGFPLVIRTWISPHPLPVASS